MMPSVIRICKQSDISMKFEVLGKKKKKKEYQKKNDYRDVDVAKKKEKKKSFFENFLFFINPLSSKDFILLLQFLSEHGT